MLFEGWSMLFTITPTVSRQYLSTSYQSQCLYRHSLTDNKHPELSHLPRSYYHNKLARKSPLCLHSMNYLPSLCKHTINYWPMTSVRVAARTFCNLCCDRCLGSSRWIVSHEHTLSKLKARILTSQVLQNSSVGRSTTTQEVRLTYQATQLVK